MNKGLQQRSEEQRQLCLLAEAMGHPFRGKLLQAVSEKSEEGVSIRRLAARLGEPKRKVRYHLDALSDQGLVEVASVADRGGVVERSYRVCQPPCIAVDLVDREQARLLNVECLKSILADARTAIAADVFGIRPGHVLIRRTAEVDAAGWAELSEIQCRALDEAEAAMKRARVRLEASDEPPMTGLVAMLLFEVPPWPPP